MDEWTDARVSHLNLRLVSVVHTADHLPPVTVNHVLCRIWLSVAPLPLVDLY
jgi:hypothetical protein